MSLNQLYRHYDKEDNLLYVGISLHQISRLAQHKISSIWYRSIVKIILETYPDRRSVLDAEKIAIINEGPIFNKQHQTKQCPEAILYKKNLYRIYKYRQEYLRLRELEKNTNGIILRSKK